ncbi:cell division protein ZapE [Rickettsiaceae bacterium]|nr:cell division protein ZapE [Rickettsiaceae bacterium]
MTKVFKQNNKQKKLDTKQKDFASYLIEIASSITEKSFTDKVRSFFASKSNENQSGIYMHGSVGTGKTMLMNIFYDALDTKKEIIHYQAFMHNLHLKFHKLQTEHISERNRIVEELAKDISSRCRVLCLDEFEIKDITDAMIIMRLFGHLDQLGVFIFLTTNTIVDNLYKDGLQRESFLPFIDMVKQKYKILHLDTDKDYRINAISEIKNRILFPENAKTNEQIKSIKNELCDEGELSSSDIEVFGRKINFKKTHQNILFTDFNEMFERDLGYADYVNICKSFRVIVLESVRAIEEDEQNIATRFINFIDNIYFARVLLFAEIICDIKKIYPKGKKIGEFARTISRLQEMNSANYLNE